MRSVVQTFTGDALSIAQNANGNLTTVPETTDWYSAYLLTYDAWNRLVQVKNGGATVATYAYDGQNWRTTKVTSGPTTRHYYYTNQWQIVEERLGSSTSPDRQNVWGLMALDNLILRDRPGLSERMYAFAGTLSITAIVNASGTVEERYGYNAYGTPNFMNASWTSIGSSAYDWDTLYNAYRYDDETTFFQVRNRYLHPTLGRWLSRDPIGYSGGLNLYAYCGDNPVNRVDAWGLDPSTVCSIDYCGPDVTAAVNNTLLAIDKLFNAGLTASDQRAVCIALYDPATAGGAWDITALQHLGQSSAINPFAGNPPLGTGKCKQTVVFNGNCVLAESLNYIAFGRMNQLCNTKFSTQPYTISAGLLSYTVRWTLFDAENAVTYHKNIQNHGLMAMPSSDGRHLNGL